MIGGLGSSIAEWQSKNNKCIPELIFLGAPDKFIHNLGSQSYVREKLGLDKGDVQSAVENFMSEIKGSLEKGENVYLRGFGSFIVKTRAEKTGRNISKNIAVKIPAHNIPAFKPAKIFAKAVKTKVAVK